MSEPSPGPAWVARRPRCGSVRLRLFCFPPAGGGSAVFHAWPEVLPEWLEVAPVLLPGRETRIAEAPFTRLEPLVRALERGLRPYLNVDYALFGHSMGALLAFETARRLSSSGARPPRLLIVSGRRAPQVTQTSPVVHQLPDREFLAYVQSLSSTSAGALAHAEIRDIVLPALRADFELCETYVYRAGPPLPCPLAVFGGRGDPEVSEADLRRWREVTAQGHVLTLFPGDHFFIESARAAVLQAVGELGAAHTTGSPDDAAVSTRRIRDSGSLLS
jgi:surfactin synthase thioesterase subunit